MAERAYGRAVRAIDAHPEARRWLSWFAPLQDHDDSIGEHPAVASRMTRGDSIISIDGARRTGRVGGGGSGVEYFCKWHGWEDHHATWQEAECVLEHWQRHLSSWTSRMAIIIHMCFVGLRFLEQ